MKQNYVLQLKADMEFMDFFMVKTIAIRVGSNRKKYLDMTLADCTGEISAKKWDISDEELDGINRIQVGDIIKVKAGVTEWKGSKQLRVTPTGTTVWCLPISTSRRRRIRKACITIL